VAEEQAADFGAGAGFGADLQGAAGVEGLHEEIGDALDVGGSGGLVQRLGGGSCRFVGGLGCAAGAARQRGGLGFGVSGASGRGWRFGFGVAGQFVEADGYGLAEIYGAMLFAGGDAEEIVAVAEVVVGEAEFFGAEEDGGVAGLEMLADSGSGLLETEKRVAKFALRAGGGGADDQGTAGDSFGDGVDAVGVGEEIGSADGGASFAVGRIVGIYEREIEEAEVAHGASGSADVERIASGDENYAEAVEFGGSGHGGDDSTAGVV
jgi:hypothetical protein